jgi:uncharacterized membrane protein
MCGFLIVFWLAVTAFVAWIVVRNWPDVHEQVAGAFAGTQARTDAAEEILRERLARGEIDADEYERSLRVLRG